MTREDVKTKFWNNRFDNSCVNNAYTGAVSYRVYKRLDYQLDKKIWMKINRDITHLACLKLKENY